MPKLKEKPKEAQDRLFQALLAKNMTLCSIADKTSLAPFLHINKRTLLYKIREPDKFTRGELRTLFDILKFTEEEKGKII